MEAYGVAYVYNHWPYMPPPVEQHRRLQQIFTAPFTVLRLLTPLKMSYAEAKQRAVPYTKIVAELPEMRRDTISLMQQSIKQGKLTYVLVNNRSEGNAPKTVQGLVEMLQANERVLGG